MRILLGYSYYPSRRDVKGWVQTRISRLRHAGFDVQVFCLTPNPPADRLSWPSLDQLWMLGNKSLLDMYAQLAHACQHYDVFVNWNGVNLHPDFVRQLPTFNVYGCFDDPESSEDLSKPVAAAYDLCMVGNIAELDSYRSWGVKNVRFWPLGFFHDDYDPALTKDHILHGDRSVDISMLCERESPWRQDRLDKIAVAFPQGKYYGADWPAGILPENEKIPLLQQSKVCINLHNSTGPINARTYYLPANGILQICDNKSHLGKIFELGKEVIGYDSIDEAIDLCRYYLAHDEERRQIAAAGWERAIRDYNECAVFSLVEKYAGELMRFHTRRLSDCNAYLRRHRRRALLRLAWHRVANRA